MEFSYKTKRRKKGRYGALSITPASGVLHTISEKWGEGQNGPVGRKGRPETVLLTQRE